MRLLALFLLAFAIASANPRAVGAQQAPSAGTGVQGSPLASGTRVRVSAASLVAPLVANYLEVRGDTLVLFEESSGRGVWTFPFSQVQRLETSIGDRRGHRPHIIRGATWGAGIGALAGLLFAATATPSDPDRKYSQPLSMLTAGIVGAGIGGYIGSRVREEAWAPIPIPRRVSLVPGIRSRVGITFSF